MRVTFSCRRDEGRGDVDIVAMVNGVDVGYVVSAATMGEAQSAASFMHKAVSLVLDYVMSSTGE